MSEAAGTIERNAGTLLSERLHEQTGVPVEIVRETVPEHGLVILLGVSANSGLLRRLLDEQRIAPPSSRDPGPEGFVLQTAASGSRLLAVGTDERGVLYAAGEILRRVHACAGGFEFPVNLHVRTAPAFRIRGTEVSQGATMRELTHARSWTRDEWRRVVLDYALAGANTFGGGGEDFAFLKSFGLLVHGGTQPNRLPGHPEWKAVEPIGRDDYVCLSIPEARRAVLADVERDMKHSLPYDFVRIPSGDPGGCWCEKCSPWGKTYILMCEDMARIIHKYLPRTRVYVTNQELSNAGDQFIFDYLNQTPRTWLAGLYYGPGSNALSWNGTKRPDHRLDLLEYPGFGVLDGYLREILHEFPRRQSIQLFTDLTHWISSQYGMLASAPMPDFNGNMPPSRDAWFYQKPDQAFQKVYNRRTFFARPRAYYAIFQATMRYAEGDITYSEGHHDQLNQWIWQRLLWSPNMPLKDVLKEYSETWFGPEAAPLMVEAILQLEQNLTAPLATNDGIDRYYRLVKEAGSRMPVKQRAGSYLWRQHMQKACLDKYVQLRLLRQTALKHDIEQRLESVLAGADTEESLAGVKARLKESPESNEMKTLREEAGRLGEESDRLFGVRSEVYFKLDQDLAGLGWMERQIQKASATSGPGRRRLLRAVARYEDPGEGGYYDDAGDPARSPHLIHGREYSANNYLMAAIANTNLPSQRTIAYTDSDSRGVTFQYSGLNPKARYTARFAFVRPRFLPRYAKLHPESKQSIYADGKLLAADVEVPEWEADLFEYPIPRELTADGKLTLWLEKSANVANAPTPLVNQWKRTAGWGTIVSDVWLICNQ